MMQNHFAPEISGAGYYREDIKHESGCYSCRRTRQTYEAAIPKPMLQVLDVPMLGWVIRACEGAGLSRICVVTGYKAQYVELYLATAIGRLCRRNSWAPVMQ